MARNKALKMRMKRPKVVKRLKVVKRPKVVKMILKVL